MIVSKIADHLPLHRQAKIFRRHGVEIADQTMCGWMAQSAALLDPLYVRLKQFVLSSKVVGTDDTPVKVLDRSLVRDDAQGTILAVSGRPDHQAVVFDYTPTRERAGPERFLKDYRGYLQADAYVAYDSFFSNPARGMVEVACWAHTRRHFHQALDTDPSRMRTVLVFIAQLYPVEKLARHQRYAGEELGLLREQASGRCSNSCTSIYWRFAISVAEERSGTSGGVHTEELAGADALLRKPRSIHRQQPYRTLVARLCGRPQ